MQTETLDASQERQVLSSLITNTEVLAKLSPIWQRNLFYSDWTNRIANWCIHHFQKHGDAPREKIKFAFQKWSDKEQRKKPELVKEMSNFLGTMSNEYERDTSHDNISFILEVTHQYINKVQLERFVKTLQAKVASGEIDDAITEIGGYSRINISESCGFDLLNSESSVLSAFSKEALEPIVEYPDGLGRFFGEVLGRDQFFSYLAAEKVGKSWMLIDMAWRAIESRRRVAYFAVGDMSENQIKRRFLSRAAKHPFRSPGNQWPYRVRIPVSIKSPADYGELPELDFTYRDFASSLDGNVAWKACEDVIQKVVKSHTPPLRIVVKPNSSINVDGITSILREWDLHGWLADVVIIDYADILAPPNRRFTNDRDAIHTTWKQMRALSQSRHCLVATATQANRASYGQKWLDRTNVADDKRKLSEVTGMAGINVYGEEKDLGLSRLNWIALREQEYSTKRCCYVAGCLPLGHPTMCSVF